jgi:hypothetical protein
VILPDSAIAAGNDSAANHPHCAENAQLTPKSQSFYGYRKYCGHGRETP